MNKGGGDYDGGRMTESEKDSLTKLFVGGINLNTSEDTFRDYFAKYGRIIDCVIIKDQNKKPRGFGFITYGDASEVDVALDNRPHTIDGKAVEIKRAIPRDDNNPSSHLRTKKLFIGGLPPTCTDEDVRCYIDNTYVGFGKTVSIELIRDKETGSVKGYGFVEVDNEDLVDRIIIDNRFPNIGGKRVEMKKAEPKEARSGRGAGGGGGGGGPFRRGGGGGRGGFAGGRPEYGGGMGGGGDHYGHQDQYNGYNGGMGNQGGGFGGSYGGSYGGGAYGNGGGSYGGGGAYGNGGGSYGGYNGGGGGYSAGGYPAPGAGAYGGAAAGAPAPAAPAAEAGYSQNAGYSYNPPYGGAPAASNFSSYNDTSAAGSYGYGAAGGAAAAGGGFTDFSQSAGGFSGRGGGGGPVGGRGGAGAPRYKPY